METVEQKEDRKYCVYLITNLVNGKQYCGQTCVGIPTRWNRHRYEASSGNEGMLYRSIRKHGESFFKVEEIESGLTREKANEREIYWINELGLTNPKRGYNMTKGGENGTLYSEPKRPDLDEADLPSLYQLGFTIPQLAEKFKASTATIWKKLRKNKTEIWQ